MLRDYDGYEKVQHPVRSDSQPMSSSQDEWQLQKTSVLDRDNNNETVVAPDDLGEDRRNLVRFINIPLLCLVKRIDIFFLLGMKSGTGWSIG